MAIKQLSDGGPDGTNFGTNTSDKIAFHGATPIAQATVTMVATAATLGDVKTSIQALQAALENLGLIADS